MKWLIKLIQQVNQKKKKKKTEEIYIPPEKDNNLLMILDSFEYKFYFLCIKIEFQKITNFLDITSDLPKFVTKKWVEVYDQSEGN